MALLSRLTRLFALLLAAAVLAAPAQAQQNVRLIEQDIKAGLFYNFLRYTQWPAASATQAARPGDAAVVCLYGGDPFSGRLAPMAGRTVNQRVIQVRTIRAMNEIAPCQMLFINASERERWPQVRAYLANRDVLTVSDFDGFASAGGMIEFTRVSDRIGVRINTGAVQSANLVVQDRLLRLASTTGSP